MGLSRHPRIAAVVGCALLVQLAGCGAGTRQATRPYDATHATELYDQLKAAESAGNLVGAEAAARELVNFYPSFPDIDDATYRAARIAVAQERYADAAALFDRVSAEYPASHWRQSAALGSATAYDHLDRAAEAADRLAALIAGPVDESVRTMALAQLRTLVRTRLSAAEVESLAARYPDSAVYDETAFDLARHAYARGDYDAAYKLLAELIYRHPDGNDVGDARRLLSLVTERREAGVPPEVTRVDPNTIGLLFPVTGQFSLYGRFFEQGAQLAVDEYNATAARPVQVVTADSRGNPVSAVTAVRSLFAESGVICVVGGVFTMPTIGAAIESNAWRAPLVSPVVSTDDLRDVGQWVFQTRIPATMEASAMAELGVRRLLLTRYAVIAPSRGPGNEVGTFFAGEIQRLGAELVATEFYDEGATDFREALERIREAAPDAIFAPGTVEELLLLLPQVKFYDLQVQLLGLSNWNSDKLLRLSREELEGALFPLEAHHGNDRAAYQRFKLSMEAKGVSDISPVSVAAYFGMKLVLDGHAAGVASREDMRRYLETVLQPDGATRSAEVSSLSLVTVRSGRIREFAPPESVDPFN